MLQLLLPILLTITYVCVFLIWPANILYSWLILGIEPTQVEFLFTFICILGGLGSTKGGSNASSN
jgi:hypothetical protein